MPVDDDDLKVDTMGLSDEEIAALESDDDEDELDDIIDEDEDKSDKSVDDESDVEKTAAKSKVADKPVIAIDETSDADDADDKSAPEFVPLMRADKVENYAEKRAEIDTKLDALDNQLEEGDIDLKQYTKEVRALNEEQTDLKMAQLTAENAEKNNLDVATQKWQWEIDRFFGEDANKIYNESKMLGAALDAAVKDIASKPENSNKNGAWFLREADKEVRKQFGRVAATDAKNIVDIKNGRKPNLKDVPKTLGSLPSADKSELGDNEFAYLEDLEGMEYEAALANLEKKDPEKAMRYLRSA